MSLVTYKIIHILGLLLLFQSLGASIFSRLSNPEGTEGHSNRMLMAMHGIGLFLMLLGGFGMLARLEIGFPFPVWTWMKIVVWLLLGAAPVLVKRRPERARIWWSLIFILGAFAAFLGLYKPF
jgi:hypothetical protein